MNAFFEHYSNLLNLEVEKYEKKYGDLETSISKQFEDELHTMQVKKQDYFDYQNYTSELEVFDYPDLVSLENYERILK